MGKDVVDIGSHRRRKDRRMRRDPFGALSGPFGKMPSVIFRIQHPMYDAPKDPPLVKLAWLLSYFGEVPLPDGKTYRLERGRLEERSSDSWEPSAASFNDLAGMATGLTRQQWQRIAGGCQPRKVVYNLKDLARDFGLDGPPTG